MKNLQMCILILLGFNSYVALYNIQIVCIIHGYKDFSPREY